MVSDDTDFLRATSSKVNENIERNVIHSHIRRLMKFYVKYGLVEKLNDYGYRMKKRPPQDLVNMLRKFESRHGI